MNLYYKVEIEKYLSINQLLREEFQISTRLLTKLKNNEKILLNGKFCDTRIQPKVNDEIKILLDQDEDNSNIKPTKMDLDIVYEDDGIVVINKTAGIAVHPSMRHFDSSLSNGVRYYFDTIGLKKKLRPVNRLDLDTSGLVVFAKNEYIQESLIKQMKNGIFKKEYICFVEGLFENKIGTINLPIARKEGSIIERCIDKNGQNAITNYEVIEEFNAYSCVKCMLETGRTHQIRVHMAYIGHPLLGDSLYGKKSEFISRQALHCYCLSFVNPINNETLDLKCDFPDDFKKIEEINIERNKNENKV